MENINYENYNERMITFKHLGKEYTLPADAIEAAYRYQKREYMKEDVRMDWAQNCECETDLSDEDCETIADRVDRILDKSDSFWDSYWLAFDYAIDEFNEGKCMG